MFKNNELWIILAFGASLAVAGFTYILPMPANGEDISYLLSSISQGLAAIFTLVFTITIFGTQTMRQFSIIDKIIDKWTKLLMIIFALGIFLPLIQLRTDKDLFNLYFINTTNLGLSINLGIAVFCVFAIIPYLMKVNRIIKYEGGISKLREEASEAIDSNHLVITSNRINELIELGVIAANDKLENETKKIVNTINDLGKNTADKEWAKITLDSLEGLEKIGLISVEKKLDKTFMDSVQFVWEITTVVKDVLTGLKDIGIKSVDKKLEIHRGNPITLSAILGLRKIGIRAIDNHFDDFSISASSLGLYEIGSEVIKNNLKHFDDPVGLILSRGSLSKYIIVKNLEEIANVAYKKDRKKYEKTIEDSMIYLWVLGAFINKYFPLYTNLMINELKESNTLVIQTQFEKNSNKAKHFIDEKGLELIKELSEFEKVWKSS